MKYLKCSSCHFYNPINSEYLTFCSQCNKKLPRNFSEWKKKHPEKKFNDYINEVGEDLQIPDKPKKSSETIKPGWWVVLIAVFIIAYFAGRLVVNEVLEYYNSPVKAEALLQKDWKKRSYGNYGVQLSTPSVLEEVNLPLPDEVKNIILDISSFKNGEEEVNVFLNTIEYHSSVGAINLEAGLQGAFEEVKMQLGATEIEKMKSNTSLNGIKGIVERGKLEMGGEEIVFVNAGYSKEMVFWQLMIIYSADDPQGEEVADRILSSLTINY